MSSPFPESPYNALQDFLNTENSTITEWVSEFSERCEECAENGFDVCQGHLYLPGGEYV